jgi:hypothetical protein
VSAEKGRKITVQVLLSIDFYQQTLQSRSGRRKKWVFKNVFRAAAQKM